MNTANRTLASPGFRPAHIGLGIVVALVIGVLAVLDWSLKQTEQNEMRRTAEQAYLNGEQLLARGRTADAVNELRRAHALDRANEDYELGLIHGLLAAGKIAEAQPLMNDLLLEEPNDGAANLTAARLELRKNKMRDAEAFYHRAIYGDWPSEPVKHRIAARLELIQLLQKQGNTQDLLAELLPLEEEADGDEQLQAKLAQLFLVAGSPSRAADIYRTILRRNPNDASAYAGLGEADLRSGEYRAAHANFLQASYHDPNNAQIHSRLELASTLASLDPTVRRLTSIEKYRRSVQVLQLARSDLQQCLTRNPSANTQALQQLLVSANAAVPAKTPDVVANEMSENILGLAIQLWQARQKACTGSSSPDEETLRLVEQKLAQ